MAVNGDGKSNSKVSEQGSGERFFESYLLAQLAIISHFFSVDFTKILRENGVSRPKWRILSNLYDTEGMYIGELVVSSLLEQSHITKVTDRLMEEGLVKKLIDKQDKRKVWVQITPLGKKTIAPLIDAAREHENKVLQSLAPEDAERLKSILGRLVQPYLHKFDRPDR